MYIIRQLYMYIYHLLCHCFLRKYMYVYIFSERDCKKNGKQDSKSRNIGKTHRDTDTSNYLFWFRQEQKASWPLTTHPATATLLIWQFKELQYLKDIYWFLELGKEIQCWFGWAMQYLWGKYLSLSWNNTLIFLARTIKREIWFSMTWLHVFHVILIKEKVRKLQMSET